MLGRFASPTANAMGHPTLPYGRGSVFTSSLTVAARFSIPVAPHLVPYKCTLGQGFRQGPSCCVRVTFCHSSRQGDTMEQQYGDIVRLPSMLEKRFVVLNELVEGDGSGLPESVADAVDEAIHAQWLI